MALRNAAGKFLQFVYEGSRIQRIYAGRTRVFGSMLPPGQFFIQTDNTGSLLVAEGSSANFNVWLSRAPSVPVTITPAIAESSRASLKLSEPLQFTSTNFDVPQTVTVEVLEDSSALGTQ